MFVKGLRSILGSLVMVMVAMQLISGYASAQPDGLYHDLGFDWVNRATRVGPRQILVNVVDGIAYQGIWDNEKIERTVGRFEPNAFHGMSQEWTMSSDGSPIQGSATTRYCFPEQAGDYERRAVRHMILLTASRDFVEGETITVQPVTGGQLLKVAISDQAKSDLVQVPHQGWTPGSPDKHAMLGYWFGPGHAADAWLSEQVTFAVVDDVTGRTVPGYDWADGRRLIKVRDAKVVQAYQQAVNNWQTMHDVYEARFPELNQPGRYRVVVKGIGSSYPFEIAANVHYPLIRHVGRGFIFLQHGDTQREKAVGPELAIPPTLRHIPFFASLRTFASISPDGVGDQGKLWSKKPIELETDPQLKAFGVDHPTEGWRDAADLDIRPQHLTVAIDMLLLSMRFPHLDQVDMGRAEHGRPHEKVIRGNPVKGTVPVSDLVHTAMYCGDAWTRLQVDTEGFWKDSVRGGIEMIGYIGWRRDFQSFSTKFKEGDVAYLTRPDPWATYAYAGFAATAAIKFDLVDDQALKLFYADRALRAWNWAEKHEGNKQLGGWNPDWRSHRHFQEAKANAAVAMWALTGAEKYHGAWESIDGHDVAQLRVSGQAFAARAYLIYDQIGYRSGKPGKIEAIKKNIAGIYETVRKRVTTDPYKSPSQMIFARPVGNAGSGEWGATINNPYIIWAELFPLLMIKDDAKYGLKPQQLRQVHQWVDADLGYTTGRNPHGRSFIYGFGRDLPRSMHMGDFAGTGLKYPYPGLIAMGLLSNRWLEENKVGHRKGVYDGFVPMPNDQPYHYRQVNGAGIHNTAGEFTPQSHLWQLMVAVISADLLGRGDVPPR